MTITRRQMLNHLEARTKPVRMAQGGQARGGLANYFDNSLDGLRRFSNAIDPFRFITPRDVATMAPGGGLVEAATEDYPAAREALREGRYLDAAGRGAAGALNQVGDALAVLGPVGAAAGAGVRAGVGGAKAATRATQRSGQTTGSRNATENIPVTLDGKPPSQWTPEDWQRYGDMKGVPNLGPLTKPETIVDRAGRTIEIPGGFDGNFTYYDLLHLKSQGINADDLPPSIHAQLQQKMARSLQAGDGDRGQIWSGLTFGMTSPNNPLFPNQVAMSRLRSSDPEELDRLASFIDWNPGEAVDAARRKAADAEIARAYGLNAGPEGGLGVRGTQDYSNLAEMAKLYRRDPDWFAKRSGEGWDDLAERTFSQLRGLSGKTGSFGVVFQDPLNAQISAMDRHMASIAGDRIFASPAEAQSFRERALSLYNRNNPERNVSNFEDLPHAFVQGEMLNELGKHPERLLRVADRASGQRLPNPEIPQRLRDESWIEEPAKATVFGPNYRRALDINAEHAAEHGLGIFPSQWMQWDRKRRRLEPHENMFPGLERLDRMSVDQYRGVDAAHRDAGFKDYSKEILDRETGDFRLRPTRPVANPSSLGYFSLPAALALPYLLREDDRSER